MNWPTKNQRGPRRPHEKVWTPPKGISPGDPDWHEQAEIDAWYRVPREELGGRCWHDVHRPCGQQEALRFMAMVGKTNSELA